jgi:cation:H+ antiporter
VAVDAILVAVGLVVLGKGADVFVHAAARLAVALDISPVVVGAVIVGFGTGAPELLVSSVAAARGSLDIAVGNVVGSNLANLTLVLGLVGVVARPATVPRVVRREAPLCLAAVALVALLLQNGLTRWEGAVLLVALGAALALMLRATEPPPSLDELAGGPVDIGEIVEAHATYATDVNEYIEEVEEFVEEPGEFALPDVAAAPVRPIVTRVVIGLAATVGGAQLLVIGAQGVADELGLSDGFVGLTVVAIGTSLPELVTAGQAARRGETALLAGNVLGSNVFNSTAVAGVAALIGPARITDAGLTVLAASTMVVVAALAWLFLGGGGRLRRWEALVLLGIYAATMPLTA